MYNQKHIKILFRGDEIWYQYQTKPPYDPNTYKWTKQEIKGVLELVGSKVKFDYE